MNLKYFDFKSKYKYLNFDLDLSYEFLIYVENFTNCYLIDLKRFFRRRLEKDFFFNEIWRKTLSNVKYITAIHFSQYPHHHHRHQHYWQVITIVTIANSSTPHFTTITILPNVDEFSKNLMFLSFFFKGANLQSNTWNKSLFFNISCWKIIVNKQVWYNKQCPK